MAAETNAQPAAQQAAPGGEPAYWIELERPATLGPSSDSVLPTSADALGRTVVGLHLMAMCIVSAVAPAWGDLAEVLAAGLALGQVVLLAVWISLGPPPLNRRAKQTALAGLCAGVMAGAILGGPSWHVAELAGGALFVTVIYLVAAFVLAQQILVGLAFFAIEVEPVHPGRTRHNQAPERVQFSILVLYRWMLLVACMLGLGRWLAAYPDTCAVFFGLLGAVWGATTGAIGLRPRLLPLPAGWKLVTVATGAFACGAALSFDRQALTAGQVSAAAAATSLGTFLVCRLFGCRLSFTPLAALQQQVRAIACPAADDDFAWLRGVELPQASERIVVE